jgi:hypothetical protein
MATAIIIKVKAIECRSSGMYGTQSSKIGPSNISIQIRECKLPGEPVSDEKARNYVASAFG